MLIQHKLTKLKKIGLGVAIAFMIPYTANAALSSFGDRTNTLDDVNNLLWMDLNQSTNVSFNQMEANFLNMGSQFYGYRHATKTEIESLWFQAGFLGPYNITLTNYFEDNMLIGTVNDYLALTGVTLSNLTQTSQFGVYNIVMGEPRVAALRNTTSSFDQLNSDTLVSLVDSDSMSTSVGHFIVKQAPVQTPTPSILSLMLLSLAGIGIVRLRK